MPYTLKIVKSDPSTKTPILTPTKGVTPYDDYTVVGVTAGIVSFLLLLVVVVYYFQPIAARSTGYVNLQAGNDANEDRGRQKSEEQIELVAG